MKYYKYRHHEVNSSVKYFVTNNPQMAKFIYKFISPQKTPNSRLKKKITSNLLSIVKVRTRERTVNSSFGATTNLFTHKHFFNSQKHFNNNNIPLIGQTPSYYLNDLKPVKHWKLLTAIQSNASESQKLIFLKLNKVQPQLRSLVKRKFRLYLLASLNRRQTNVRSRRTSKLSALHKFKPFVKRVPVPNYVLKWKTSYPLMFTANTSDNRSKKNRLDITVNYFMRSRLSRRVRRTTRNFFKKVKRLVNKKRRSRNVYTFGHNLQTSTSRWLFKKKQLGYNSILSNNRNRHIRIKNITLKHTLRAYKYRSRSHTKLVYLVRNQSKCPVEQTTKQYSTPFSKTVSKVTKHPKKLSLTTLRKHNKQTPWRLLASLRNIQRNHTFSPTNLLSMSYVKDTVPTIHTRTRKNLVFKNIGMFLNALTFSNQKNPFTYKFIFKKKLFSFLYPNEVRNSLMNRKKRITFYKLIHKFKHRAKNKPRYSLASFNKFFLNHYKASLSAQSNNAITDSLFTNKSLPNKPNLNYQNYLTSRDEILYPNNFTHRGQDLSFRWSEVKIPRVRFKPGYQRMWRRARTALKESLNLKFVYQKQLTRYLTRFYKGSNRYTFSRAEMSLNRVIMYSRLLPDNPTVDSFLSKKLVYLNGRVAYDTNTILVPNDVVQLIVSMWYYVTYRWIANWTLKRGKKFKKLVYRKGLAGKQKVMKLKKQRSYYTPNWIYLTRYDISDVKPYLEVDYFTLSTIVLYEPFTTYYFSPDETPDFRPTIYRMYNWKYIT